MSSKSLTYARFFWCTIRPTMQQIAFDMETNDPDDAFTLCILATHPLVELVSVTVMPGSDEQVGVVRHILKTLGRDDVPIGSYRIGPDPKPVSGFHYTWLGKATASKPDGEAADILRGTLSQGVTLLTGAPLKNLGVFFQRYGETLGQGAIHRWVGQGGFAGDSVVPPELRLAKFAGKETCPTFNFNGAPDTAKLMLATDKIGERLLVSKNVCHGVVYDTPMHTEIGKRLRTPGMELVYQGMAKYLARTPEGKKFHDPLAAAVAIDPSVCVFREVDVYRQKGEWGSRLASGTNTRISIDIDRPKFLDILTMTLAGVAQGMVAPLIALIGLDADMVADIKSQLAALVSIPFRFVEYPTPCKGMKSFNGRFMVPSLRAMGLWLEPDAVIWYGYFDTQEGVEAKRALAISDTSSYPDVRRTILHDDRLASLLLAKDAMERRFDRPRGWLPAGASTPAYEGAIVTKVGNRHCGDGKERHTEATTVSASQLVEPFVEGESIRVLIVEGETWVHRYEAEDWRKNVGATVTDVSSEERYRASYHGTLQERAYHLAKNLRLDPVGIDYIVPEKGDPMLLEVNAYPGLDGAHCRPAYVRFVARACAWLRAMLEPDGSSDGS